MLNTITNCQKTLGTLVFQHIAHTTRRPLLLLIYHLLLLILFFLLLILLFGNRIPLDNRSLNFILRPISLRCSAICWDISHWTQSADPRSPPRGNEGVLPGVSAPPDNHPGLPPPLTPGVPPHPPSTPGQFVSGAADEISRGRRRRRRQWIARSRSAGPD